MGKRDRNHDRGHGSHAGDPLVIDLPEGQKLYVGSLDDGMAIEVATWRGIGEPDSRVARMIIAANRDGAPQASAHTIPLTDVSRLGARPGDGRAEASAWVQQETAAGEGANEFEASGTTSGALRFARRAASILVGVPLSAATAAVLAGWIVVAKPIPSLATELGLGNSGVIIAATSPTYAVGDEVLARVSAHSNQAAVVANVLAVSPGKVTIATNGAPVVLEEGQILGRLITKLPIGAEAVDRPLLAGAMIAALLIGILVFAL